MSFSRLNRLPIGLISRSSRPNVFCKPNIVTCPLRWNLQTRKQHNRVPRPPRYIPTKTENEPHGYLISDLQPGQPYLRVRYLRPAIWALVVSGGIFTGLAYLQAKEEVKPKKIQGWPSAPQWPTMQTRGPPTPTEVAARWWDSLNPISKLSFGIIAANSAVHLTSFVMPSFWNMLWHLPARNANYTQFTSMFVHSGGLHLFFNMYFTYNFMLPVGYSPVFEGNPYHLLAFFLSTGTLSGYGQHLSTLISKQKHGIPEVLIRCGGASGALLGMFSLFCTQNPTAGIGLFFLPIHFEAQYVLSAFMLFDLVGVVRGFSFLNIGHGVSVDSSSKVCKELT